MISFLPCIIIAETGLLAEQTLEVQILLETAPLRLLSLQNTGLSNVDLTSLCSMLTANPAECATQACLTVLKLGPPVQWTTDCMGQQHSKAVSVDSEMLQQLLALPGHLPELQVLQVWGLDQQQQLDLKEAWIAAKGSPTVQSSADSVRLSSIRQAHCALDPAV